MSPSSFIAVLRDKAEQEIKKQLLEAELETADGQQKNLALNLALSRLPELVQHPSGAFPCPICFIRGKTNILTADIHSNTAFHCVICGFVVHETIP